VSRKRKKNSTNPAKTGRFLGPNARAEWEEFTSGLRDITEKAMDESRQALLDLGASEEQIDTLLRVQRCRIGYEALEIGQVEVFNWVVAPVSNEIDIRMAMGEDDGPLALLKVLEEL
jgi:D-mannonate dehydratase